MTKTIQNGGFTNPSGGLLTGNLLLVLSQDAKVAAAPNQVAPIATRIPIAAGNIAPTLIYFNDELLPGNTTYTATAYDAAGNKVYGPEIWSLTGAGPLDLGTLVPLLISPDPLFSNPVLQNPAQPQTISGTLTLTGSQALSTGNVALRNFSADRIQYVSTGGNDANDGLSWGTAKLTVQAAINAATSTGTTPGTVMIGCSPVGNGLGFTGPTTFYNGLTLWGACSWQVPGVAQSSLVYTSSVTIANVSGLYFHNIVFDFNYNAAGLVIGNTMNASTFDGVTLKNCGDTAVDCLSYNVTGTTAAANSTDNHWSNIFILANNTPSHFANCLTMRGAGPVNNGGFATDNYFEDVVCSGNINNGIVMRLNTDTNYFQRFWVQNTGPTQANSGCLVINDQTPASDQDADGGFINGLICAGGFTNTFRFGQTNGWVISATANSYSLGNLGGTPLYTLQSIGLAGINANFSVGGQIVASAIAGMPQATGSAVGDLTAARTTSLGVLNLGTDGANIARTGNLFEFIGPNGNVGAQLLAPEVTAPAGSAGNGIIWPDSGSHCWKFNNNNAGTSGCIPQVVASGTAVMATASIAAVSGTTVTCGTATSVSATGVTTTDAIIVSPNASPGSPNGGLIINAWPTTNQVNFAFCNPTASALTPNAATLNWRVVR